MKTEIKRESTWDYETETVKTIETWEWNNSLNRYELVRLEEEETGEYIPYCEEEYIRDGAVSIPGKCRGRRNENMKYVNQITCTNGNRRNRISGSRITVYGKDGEIIDRFEVPARNGKRYCEKHSTGQYGKRYFAAINKIHINNPIK